MSGHDLRRRAAGRAAEPAGHARAPQCAPSSSTGSRRRACRASRRSASSARSACRRWRARRRSSAAIERREGVVYAGLALNERGYDRLRDAGSTRCTSPSRPRRSSTGGTPARTRRGGRRGRRARSSSARARTASARRSRSASRSAARSRAPSTRAASPSSPRARRAGADEIVVADTVGVGVPRQVRDLVGAACALGRPVGVHLHNTRNTGFANAIAALEAGATVFDASVGGIGGCPFAPRATGNIATEDLVYLLHGEGIETGIDLDALIGVARVARRHARARARGQVYRAGTFAPVAG